MRQALRHLTAALALVLGLCAPALAERVTVFAAASLKPALDEIKPLFETETGDTLTLVFAGSSTLARQISQGAPADVFISANVAWMDRLEADGLLQAGGRVDLLTNALVIIAAAPAESIPLNMITDGKGRIAMALTQAVPAGIYAREALESLGLWAQIAPRVVQTSDVRAALALTLRGEADFGVVYRSDAASEPRAVIVRELPSEAHSPIIYPAALLAKGSTASAGFLNFLQSDTASAVFVAQGFGLASEPPR